MNRSRCIANRVGFAVAVVFLSILFAARAVATPPSQMIGSVAPDWQLESLDGQRWRLSQFKGRAVVVNFWATWCAPCRVETKWLTELYTKYQPRGLAVLGVSMDEANDRSEVARFAKFFGVNYTILLHGHRIADRYGGIQYLPQTFFIDASGKIVNATRGIADKATLDADVQRILPR